MVPTILSQIHNSPYEAAHEGPVKLAIRINSQMYWPTLREDAREYTQTCDVCQKSKPSRQNASGLLHPNPVPTCPYEWVSLNLIIGLPKSDGFNAILVTVDRCTKHAQFIPCKGSLDARGFARLFIDYIVFNFSLPEHIIADRDPR